MKLWKTISFIFYANKTKKKKQEAKTKGPFEKQKDVENIKTDQSKIYHANEIDQSTRCRICLDLGDDPQQELCIPCQCSGSIRYAHVKCLKAWIKEKKSVECEICHKPYRNKWKMWAYESNIIKSKSSSDGSLFHNRHLGLRIVFLLHFFFWGFLGICLFLNNKSIKDMESGKYFFLVKICKINMMILIILTILVNLYWTLIYKNFEFYCEAFQRQLKEANELNNGIQIPELTNKNGGDATDPSFDDFT